MSSWKFVVPFTIFVAFFAAGLVLFISRSTAYTPFELLPYPTPQKLTVHVAGGVKSPGVYIIEPGSRITDAVKAAGGFSSNANPNALNLAEMVSDGQKIEVPYQLDPSVPKAAQAEPVRAVLININTADAALLSTLPGIGETRAADIIAYRAAHGAFTSIEQLLEVKGIGPGNYEKIKDLVTIR